MTEKFKLAKNPKTGRESPNTTFTGGISEEL